MPTRYLFGGTDQAFLGPGNVNAVTCYSTPAFTAPVTDLTAVMVDGTVGSPQTQIIADSSGSRFYAFYGPPDWVDPVYVPKAYLAGTATPDPLGGFLRINPTNIDGVIDRRLSLNPSVISAATTAVNTVVSTLGVPTAGTLAYTTYTGDVWFMGDSTGRQSQLGVSADGHVAEATAVSLNTVRGMPRVTASADGTGGVRFQDAAGNDSWIGCGPDGLPDPIAKRAFYNTNREYRGPDQPDPYPGNLVRWYRTDRLYNPTGDIIDVRRSLT